MKGSTRILWLVGFEGKHCIGISLKVSGVGVKGCIRISLKGSIRILSLVGFEGKHCMRMSLKGSTRILLLIGFGGLVFQGRVRSVFCVVVMVRGMMR